MACTAAATGACMSGVAVAEGGVTVRVRVEVALGIGVRAARLSAIIWFTCASAMARRSGVGVGSLAPRISHATSPTNSAADESRSSEGLLNMGTSP